MTDVSLEILSIFLTAMTALIMTQGLLLVESLLDFALIKETD